MGSAVDTREAGQPGDLGWVVMAFPPGSLDKPFSIRRLVDYCQLAPNA